LRSFDHAQKSSDNAMPLSQIRDAALRSRFASRGQLERWLARAVGPQRSYLETALWHARRGLQHCPLLGEAYVYLGDLCFLDGVGSAAKAPCVAQALKVRPYSGEVLLTAGSDAALAGNLELALRYWRGAIQKDRVAQIALADLMVAYGVPVAFVVEQFRPPLAVVRLLDGRYSAAGLAPDQLRPLLVYYAQVGREEAERRTDHAAADAWVELHDVYRRLNEPERMFDCLRRALQRNANDYGTHFAIACRLLEHRQFDEAEKQLRWCLQRKPGEAQLEEMLARAVKERLAMAAPSGAPGPPARR
jgi:tetratricopeptide (TPR) repeat protein